MKNLCFSMFAFLLLARLSAQHAYIEQPLLDHMATAPEGEMIPVVLMLEDVVDVQALKSDMQQHALPVSRRPQAVMAALKAKADATQPAIVAFLEQSAMPHAQVQRFWITNSIGLSANAALIEALAARSDVAYISHDAPMVGEVDHFKASANMAKSEGGIEPGLAVIGAPEMWAMGYTGHGRLAMTFDTGVWPDHPALTARFLPNIMPLSRTWFPFDSPVPTDKASSHGTHVSGTMLGLDPATADTIGVAFGAYFIATDPTVGGGQTPKPLTDVMLGFEWALNPDGDDETSDDVPDVINNSWGRAASDVNPPCAPFVLATFEAVEAAGIASVFSAGNAGPDPETIGVPNNTNIGLVNSFAVGALNGNASGPDYPIANFSSRGPSLCPAVGSMHIKPEVSAPGVAVRSSVGSDGYDSFSGTSMAAPHTSGALLLLKEAFPYLSGEELMLALFHSASDLGEPGEDNTFGMGLINVKAAYDYLALDNDPVAPASNDIDLQLVAIVAPTDGLLCSSPGGNTLQPAVHIANTGSSTVNGFSIHYSVNGGTETSADFGEVLQAGASGIYELPGIAGITAGGGELHVYIAPLDNEYDVFNNHAVYRWTQVPLANEPLPFYDDFSAGLDAQGWTVLNPDLSNGWETIDDVLLKDGSQGQAARMDFSSYTTALNQRDFLKTAIFELPGPPEPYNLSFDYFYRKATSSQNLQDTLVVWAVVGCAGSETAVQHQLFRKGGAQLWTNDVNFTNALPQSTVDWGSVSLDVALDEMGIEDDGTFYIMFEGINRAGNNLLIDNVNLTAGSAVHSSSQRPSLSTVPNPTRDAVLMQWSHKAAYASIHVYDLGGRLLLQQGRLMRNAALDLTALPEGLYLVEAQYEDGSRAVAKVVKW